MAKHLLVLFNFKGATPVDDIKLEMNKFKDWLKVGAEIWMVYTEVEMPAIRNRFYERFKDQDPSILVFPLDTENWSVYASGLARDWINRVRTPEEFGGE
jgi:hypothetical protein